MNFNELNTKRYSCRAYDPARPVTDAQVTEILEAARMSPSAVNFQPWHFVVVRDQARRAQCLAKSRPAFLDAPVLIVACANPSQAWTRPADSHNHADIDLAIAIQDMMLQITDLGLASCWVCSFDIEGVRAALKMPDNIRPVALLPIGYATEGPCERHFNRKPLSEIVSYETFA